MDRIELCATIYHLLIVINQSSMLVEVDSKIHHQANRQRQNSAKFVMISIQPLKIERKWMNAMKMNYYLLKICMQ